MWHQWGLVDPSSSTSTMQKHKHNITQRQWTNQTNQPKTHFHVPDYIRLKSILLSKTCLLCDLYWRHCPQQNTWKVQLIPVVTWRQTQIKIKHKSKAPNSNSRHATISKITCNSTFSYKKISQGARFLHFFLNFSQLPRYWNSPPAWDKATSNANSYGFQTEVRRLKNSLFFLNGGVEGPWNLLVFLQLVKQYLFNYTVYQI